MRIVLDKGAIKPTKAHREDAGFDLYSTETHNIPARGFCTFGTGVHMQIPKGYAGVLVSKSGLNVRENITSTGLIDSGYTGEIKVKLYNHGFRDFEIKKGDRISQIVLIPIWETEIEVVDEIGGGERGERGFGSSGR